MDTGWTALVWSGQVESMVPPVAPKGAVESFLTLSRTYLWRSAFKLRCISPLKIGPAQLALMSRGCRAPPQPPPQLFFPTSGVCAQTLPPEDGALGAENPAFWRAAVDENGLIECHVLLSFLSVLFRSLPLPGALFPPRMVRTGRPTR